MPGAGLTGYGLRTGLPDCCLTARGRGELFHYFMFFGVKGSTNGQRINASSALLFGQRVPGRVRGAQRRHSGTFNAPRGVTVEPDGDLVVADTGKRRVVTVRGALPGKWSIWLPLVASSRRVEQ